MHGYHRTDRRQMRRAVEDREATLAEIKLLICSWLNEFNPGDIIQLPKRVVAEDTGLAPRTIIKARQKLVAKGYLQELDTPHARAKSYRLFTDDESEGVLQHTQKGIPQHTQKGVPQHTRRDAFGPGSPPPEEAAVSEQELVSIARAAFDTEEEFTAYLERKGIANAQF